MAAGWRRLGGIVKQVGREFVARDIGALAAGAAYYCFFSVFPLVLFAAPLLSVVGDRQQTFDFLLRQVQGAVPPDAYRLLQGVFTQVVFAKGAPGVLSLGAVLTIWSASNIFSALRDALNHAFGVQETRPIWKYYLIAMAFVIGASIFLLIATVILIDGEDVVSFVASHVGLSSTTATIWLVLQFPIAILLVIAFSWAMFSFLPNGCFTKREALISSVVATILWLIVTAAFRAYVQHFGSYNKVYGTIGAVIILLTWMYLSMLAVLLGGEVGAVLHSERQPAGARPPARPAPGRAPAPLMATKGRDSSG